MGRREQRVGKVRYDDGTVFAHDCCMLLRPDEDYRVGLLDYRRGKMPLDNGRFAAVNSFYYAR